MAIWNPETKEFYCECGCGTVINPTLIVAAILCVIGIVGVGIIQSVLRSMW